MACRPNFPDLALSDAHEVSMAALRRKMTNTMRLTCPVPRFEMHACKPSSSRGVTPTPLAFCKDVSGNVSGKGVPCLVEMEKLFFAV